MSVSSVGSTNPIAYLQKLFSSDDFDPSEAAAPSDPLQSLFQAATGGGNPADDGADEFLDVDARYRSAPPSRSGSAISVAKATTPSRPDWTSVTSVLMRLHA